MLREMIEYSCKIKEEGKPIQSEIKKIYREPTVKGRKLGFKSTIWNKRKKQYSTGAERRNKSLKISEEGLKNHWDNFKCSNIQIVWVPEGEEEEQEFEKLFEEIMKENFPNLVKKIVLPEFQEAQRVTSWTQREAHQDTL